MVLWYIAKKPYNFSPLRGTMSVNFKGRNRKQLFLFPPIVEDWLPEDHLARFVVEMQETKPAIEELQRYGSDLEEITGLLADNGYFSNANCALVEKTGITPYIAIGRERHNQSLENRFSVLPPLPEGADSKNTMRHRLYTKVGKACHGH